ncbi:putative zinc finger (C-x8-C-x5-C-x3-H)-2 [Cardiosporidium cionae]|uniref:Zinc finger (C-x8-C-x5-C-x3-H)-2 n=1 Tax=Cardiosporidium cionae TaxID=476202 RepID=A0ABQ7JD71_9APIC|nr:putative zinc finger (C-x8-C-x5-C-x3-H)-2 [Cardiosporidium cionae]|eukprot:KAF8821967.1 putative zinc finger (C-x8-C-x5-C-x3-H)-2 [Cardiosporidium cionae]
MPPPTKKKDSKEEKGERKAVEKQKQKIAEDKTFGLKNKNKSKTVQKYIKGVQQQVKGPVSAKNAAKPFEEKEEKKKKAQQELLLASLFKGTENVKKIAASGNSKTPYNPKLSREKQKINFYIDQREQKLESLDGTNEKASINEVGKGSAAGEALYKKTDIVCKYFLQAIEKKHYGWLWVCPNGGDSCIYRHCLPAGYVLKQDNLDTADTKAEVLTLEEIIENERAALTTDGTPVTLETFLAWKEKKERDRLTQLEEKRQSEAVRTGTRGLHVLSGKDLFTFDPSLFVDAEGAAFGEDYEEDEAVDEIIKENQRIVDEANKEALERQQCEDTLSDNSSSDDSASNISEDERANEKREDSATSKMIVSPINADLFLADDVPENLEDLDD